MTGLSRLPQLLLAGSHGAETRAKQKSYDVRLEVPFALSIIQTSAICGLPSRKAPLHITDISAPPLCGIDFAAQANGAPAKSSSYVDSDGVSVLRRRSVASLRLMLIHQLTRCTLTKLAIALVVALHTEA
jgi:hypothetical protein